jgi:hypothetical protein
LSGHRRSVLLLALGLTALFALFVAVGQPLGDEPAGDCPECVLSAQDIVILVGLAVSSCALITFSTSGQRRFVLLFTLGLTALSALFFAVGQRVSDDPSDCLDCVFSARDIVVVLGLLVYSCAFIMFLTALLMLIGAMMSKAFRRKSRNLH